MDEKGHGSMTMVETRLTTRFQLPSILLLKKVHFGPI